MPLRKLGAVLGVIALALVAAASASALGGPRVISLLDVGEQSTSIPPFSETAAPPVGARLFFTDGLYTWAGTKRGQRIGRLEGTCTITGRPDERSLSAYCTASVFVPAGQILIAGAVRFTEQGAGTSNVAVVGGTGRYSNARGSGTIRDIGATGNSAVVLWLVP